MDTINNQYEDMRVESQRDPLFELAAQVAHDIKSPVASILMLMDNCQGIPEEERGLLRQAIMSIQGIANTLLRQYKRQDEVIVKNAEKRELVLASSIALQVLATKRVEYADLPIKFEHRFSELGNSALIKIESLAFQRALSNIINNAVDAYEGKAGEITLSLDVDNECLKLVVADNGRGMSPEVVKKVLANLAVTEGKKDGHGIGLTQVRETLQRNQGSLAIDSTPNVGTKIILSFREFQNL